MSNTLSRSYFESSPLKIARDLIGKILEVKTRFGLVTLEIVETEAYMGRQDPASHAYKHKTPSNSQMFMEPGTLYVYFTYGMHYCMNVKCWPPGTPGAVLFRGLRPISGFETLYKLSGKDAQIKLKDLTNGPAKLTRALGIDKSFNGYDITLKDSNIKILNNPGYNGRVVRSPRIGISRNTDKLWRFYEANCEFVSKHRFPSKAKPVAICRKNT
jgi:DNA-3-methyladenine glycosylase